MTDQLTLWGKPISACSLLEVAEALRGMYWASPMFFRNYIAYLRDELRSRGFREASIRRIIESDPSHLMP